MDCYVREGTYLSIDEPSPAANDSASVDRPSPDCASASESARVMAVKVLCTLLVQIGAFRIVVRIRSILSVKEPSVYRVEAAMYASLAMRRQVSAGILAKSVTVRRIPATLQSSKMAPRPSV